MLLPLLICLLLFFAVTLGLAWPLVSRFALDPAEKLCASAVLSLLGVYLTAFAIYVLRLPPVCFWLLPVLAGAGLVGQRRSLIVLFGDTDARAMLIGQWLLAGWCLGWLALVVSYSGGGWTSDWYEHWERTRFFAEHWPYATKFLGFNALPARPPLANLVTGALLGPTGLTFAGYQLVTTLLNVLVFLPAALLARRFRLRPGSGGPAALAVLTVLLMLNPSFVENATFAWTKLITAFFILSGLYFFLRANDSEAPASAGPLCAVSLAAGVLAHYSAGPYVILLAGAWFGLNRARWRDPAWWRRTAQLGLIGGLILATWFGWSLAVYGVDTTLFSNSTVAVPEARQGNQLLKIALNLRDTVVPHFLRTVDPALITQRSPWSYARDWFFQLYQVNLLFLFGSAAWLVLAVRLFHDGRSTSPRSRGFWLWFSGGAILLGIAVHGARDHWGLAHICLQAVLVLGLAYLAARWPGLGRGWRLALVAGAAVDFCLGIALQFAAQSQTPDLAFVLGRAPAEALPQYNGCAVMNLAAKLVHGLVFFSDALAAPPLLITGLLAILLLLALRRARAIAE
jgi:hypothetical protein